MNPSDILIQDSVTLWAHQRFRRIVKAGPSRRKVDKEGADGLCMKEELIGWTSLDLFLQKVCEKFKIMAGRMYKTYQRNEKIAIICHHGR